MSGLLTAENLSFAYGGVGGRPREQVPWALEDVGISLSSGEVVAVVGPNGSGKSTLIRSLLGHLAGSGVIRWEDRVLGKWRQRDLARVVAYLPQAPTWQAGQTVADALAVGRAPYWGLLGLESAGDEKVVVSVAAMLGVRDLLDRRMDELSGGQRQIVLLGRCLVQEPRAMLLDEPDTYLDLKHQIDLCRLLRGLARERGMGVLMASHDLNLAAGFADKIVLLSEGRVAAAGVPDEVLTAKTLEKVYGLPMERIERAGGRGVLLPKETGG